MGLELGQVRQVVQPLSRRCGTPLRVRVECLGGTRTQAFHACLLRYGCRCSPVPMMVSLEMLDAVGTLKGDICCDVSLTIKFSGFGLSLPDAASALENLVAPVMSRARRKRWATIPPLP